MLRNLTAALVVLAVAGIASAANVALTFQVDEGTNTWQVYAEADASTQGIAGFEINVTADGGVAVLTALNKSPRPYDANLDDFIGFSLLRTNGSGGMGIAAAQNTVAGDPAYLLLGAASGAGAPILLAQGTYSWDGSAGNLYADAGAGINIFPSDYVAGGAAATASVTGDVYPFVPEPATMSLLGMGALALIRRRR